MKASRSAGDVSSMMRTSAFLNKMLSVVVRSTGNGTSGMSLRARSEFANRLFRPGMVSGHRNLVSHSFC